MFFITLLAVIITVTAVMAITMRLDMQDAKADGRKVFTLTEMLKGNR